MNKIAIIIPARFKSSRFPGKPLVKILGKEMIIRVAKICQRAVGKKNVFIATDNLKIKKVCSNFNLNVIMTSSNCATGTDRVFLASKKIKSKIFINVQGDEPMIKINDILKVIKFKKKNPDCVVCGFSSISHKEAKNVNVPKVVINKNNKLIYMSRSLVPGTKKNSIKRNFFKQVCIYAFNKMELKKFYNFKKKFSKNETAEDIEILRFLEIDIPIKMVKVSGSSIAVDIKSDIKKVEKKLKR
jgi:3-deoxy-manno-octulosonate cytidylyltransferase (CMP-KDO synthetase)